MVRTGKVHGKEKPFHYHGTGHQVIEAVNIYIYSEIFLIRRSQGYKSISVPEIITSNHKLLALTSCQYQMPNSIPNMYNIQ